MIVRAAPDRNIQPPAVINRRYPTCGSDQSVVNPASLRWLREKSGMTIGEFARRFDLRVVDVSDFERGRKAPTRAVLDAYHEAAGI